MQKDNRYYSFTIIPDTVAFAAIKSEWRQTLTAPQDGMWEAFTDNAVHWELKSDDQRVGYACVGAENQLLQFYVRPQWLPEGVSILEQFIGKEEIVKGMIGTNNPIFLSLATHLQKSVTVDTYLFTNFFEVSIPQGPGQLRPATFTDLVSLVDFYHHSTGGPKEWLSWYLEGLIEREELYMLEDKKDILGTCEIRKSNTNPGVADIGMVVAEERRRKGLGTYLLGEAKEIALSWGWQPICSCEKDNIGSLKAIHKNGFRSQHQMLKVVF